MSRKYKLSGFILAVFVLSSSGIAAKENILRKVNHQADVSFMVQPLEYSRYDDMGYFTNSGDSVKNNITLVGSKFHITNTTRISYNHLDAGEVWEDVALEYVRGSHRLPQHKNAFAEIKFTKLKAKLGTPISVSSTVQLIPYLQFQYWDRSLQLSAFFPGNSSLFRLSTNLEEFLLGPGGKIDWKVSDRMVLTAHAGINWTILSDINQSIEIGEKVSNKRCKHYETGVSGTYFITKNNMVRLGVDWSRLEGKYKGFAFSSGFNFSLSTGFAFA